MKYEQPKVILADSPGVYPRRYSAYGFLTQLSSLQFGNVSLGRVSVVAADVFAPLRNPVGGKLDGIIGYNVMRQFCITIDYPMKRMRFES